MIIDELWQYPVKGLGGVTLAEARLQACLLYTSDAADD